MNSQAEGVKLDSQSTPTEQIDHIHDRAQLCLSQAEQIQTKLFGAPPSGTCDEDAIQDPSLVGSTYRLRNTVESLLLPLLQEISARL